MNFSKTACEYYEAAERDEADFRSVSARWQRDCVVQVRGSCDRCVCVCVCKVSTSFIMFGKNLYPMLIVICI